MHNRRFTAREKERALKAWFQIGLSFAWKIARAFHCAESSLWRWKARYDNTTASLEALSSRPHTPHPNSHTAKEYQDILQAFKEHPDACISEIYGVLRHEFAYTRSYFGFYKFIKTHDIYGMKKVNEHYVPQPYDTPDMIGQKMQMDVKYVPTACLRGKALYSFQQDGRQLYQYTMIDEASRERFIYIYPEQSSHSTIDFVKRAFTFFGYLPKIVQTDNGTEFTNYRTGDKAGKNPHRLDIFLDRLNIKHQLIRVRTPRHNGKVERSHQNDQKRFYEKCTFTSLADCQAQAAAYLTRSNNIPSSALKSLDGKRKWLSPNEKREELMEVLKFRKWLKQQTSILCLPAPSVE